MTTQQHPPPVTRALCWLVLALGAVTIFGSRHWVDASFPGFFLMPNRVVPSAGLPGWAGGRDGRPVYQHVLVAVDGVTVDGARDAYHQTARHTLEHPVEYRFVRDGAEETRMLPVRRFTRTDYVGIFGAYGLTGIAYLTLAFIAAGQWLTGERTRALAAFAWAGAVFSFTGMDLYGSGTTFRLHAAAETFLAAGAAHVALSCPRPAFPGRRGLPLLVYGMAAMLTVVYEIFLYEPRAYSVLHNLCQGLVALPIMVLAARLAMELGDAANVRDRRVLQLQLGGTLIGLVAPALVFGISALAGGDVPVSTAAWFNFVFPFTFAASLWVAVPHLGVPAVARA